MLTGPIWGGEVGFICGHSPHVLMIGWEGRIVCYALASGRQSAVGRTTGDDPTLDTCMRGDGLDRPDYGFIVRAAQGSRAKIRCTIGSKAERGMVS